MTTIKRIFLIIVLSSFSFLKAQAQPYQPMLAQFNEWHITDCFFGCITSVYYTDEEVVIDGFNYHVLDGFHYINRNFFLREDTAERQVFFLGTGLGKEDLEFLLYDFSMLPGDSMLVYNPFGPLPDSAGYFTLDSIVPEIQIDGESYRHFYLSAADSTLAGRSRAEWIEGMGSLNLINTAGTFGDINNGGAVSCFFTGDTLRYSNLDSIAGCVKRYPNLSVERALLEDGQSSIFPNPASTVLHLTKFDDQIRAITIYDMMGRSIIQLEGSDQISQQINIEMLPKGSYVVKIISSNGDDYIQKLMIE